MNVQTFKFDISNVNAHLQAAKELIAFAQTEKIFLFDAPMGAGKTTFIKSVCAYLEVVDAMSSPTYSIVNEYKTQAKTKIFHFDLYRLQSSEELLDIGFEEYIDSGHYNFIEWPELAMPFINHYIKVSIELEGNNRYLYARKF